MTAPGPAPTTAPVLSTPSTHIFEDPTPLPTSPTSPRLSDEQIAVTYEVARTVREIRAGRWKRIALQFPDGMLRDAPRVFGELGRKLRDARGKVIGGREEGKAEKSKRKAGVESADDLSVKMEGVRLEERNEEDVGEKLFILGDTSYGACCVDEVAAEHVDADVVVHYGRSCLSPTSRLPVIYVFTERPLDLDAVMSAFIDTYPDKEANIVLMADIPYCHHIAPLHTLLAEKGYTQIFATKIIHHPSSLLPNRTTPSEAKDSKDTLRNYALFHISDPPPALLLTLHSRVASIHIYPTTSTTSSDTHLSPPRADLITITFRALSRRYALLASLSSTPIIGILLNTLSIRNHLAILSHIQRLISRAGKKYYTVVVGKVNPAKVANFAEVGGWVVVGCWENSLVQGEGKEGFWKPMVTPWELEAALKGEERVWTGEWEGGFQGLLDARDEVVETGAVESGEVNDGGGADQQIRAVTNLEDVANVTETNHVQDIDQEISDEESEPPEFDLRTGRYVSHSRPMRTQTTSLTSTSAIPASNNPVPAASESKASTALSKRTPTALATIGGIASPGAEFLHSGRTWQGLGSEFAEEDREIGVNTEGRGARVEEGRRGIARGYVVGDGVGNRH